MSSPSTYATGAPRLLKAIADLLAAEVEDELDATQAALDDAGITVALPPPAEIRTAEFAVTRDVLPLVVAHIMENQQSLIDSAGQDTVQTTVRIYVTVGEGDLAADDESGYSAGMHAYLGAISGLIQRRLPIVACDTAAVFEVHHRGQRWEPAVDTQAGTWIQRGRLDLVAFQTVTYQTPESEE
jgi:hypothetical protein